MSPTNKASLSVQMFMSLNAAQSMTAGGKGASLACLYQNGFPVPNGFVILPCAFLKDKLSDEAKAVVRAGLDELREKDASTAFAVRSSAVSEDSVNASFAGEFETLLDQKTDSEVYDAIFRVRQSRKSERVRTYSKEKGISSEHEMAVVVQRMVHADVSGVLFTADPINHRRGQAVINASAGLGESVVSGTVTPDTYRVDKEKLNAAKATKAIITCPKGNPVLSPEQIVLLTRLALRIEVFFGAPMDIEWTLSDEGFSIVQARPITTLADDGYVWKLPKGMYAAVRNNIVEMMPNPLTPLFGTLGRKQVNLGMGKALDTVIGMHNAMPKELIIRVNHYAFYNGSISFVQIMRILLGSGKILKRMFTGAVERWTEDFRPDFFRSVQRWAEKDLGRMSENGLFRAIKELASLTVEAYTTLVSGIIPAAWITEGLFTFWYRWMVKTKQDAKAYIYLLGFDSKPVEAEKTLFDLAKWAKAAGLENYLKKNPAGRIAADFQANRPVGNAAKNQQELRNRFRVYIEQFGGIIYDLDFAKPVPSDHPEPQIEALKFFLSEKAVNPHERQAHSAKSRDAAAKAVEDRLRRGLRLRVFQKRLAKAQKFAPLRENGLSEVGLAYPVLRRMVLELGRRFVQRGMIEKADDAFWLTEDEVEEAIRRTKKANLSRLLAPAVSTRKSGLAQAKRVSPPRTLPSIQIKKTPPKQKSRIGNKDIKGVAASAGIVSAKACVIRGPEDFDKMETGGVLVAPFTTPAWTPLFTRASAVVTDIGGPLSHGSIVAREYGIPAVMGTGDATSRIRPRQTVTVDGGKGTVTAK